MVHEPPPSGLAGSDAAIRGNGRSGLTPSPATFIDLVAHELRTPLAVVTAASETLLSAGDRLRPDDAGRLLAAINRNSRQLAAMLDQLVLAHAVETREVRLDGAGLAAVDLVALVQMAIDDLAEVVLNRHEAVLHAPTPVTALVDDVGIREVVGNLLSNAVKYSEVGTRIDIAVQRIDGTAVVTVADQGVGVSREDAVRIFDPYVQVDHGYAGVGLGLFISRGIARAHGGDLYVRGAGGPHSAFVLEVPVAGPAGPEGPEVGANGRATPSAPAPL